MIEFQDLTKSYAEEIVLGPVSGRIEPGGVTALVGPNGAGKSTLLTLLGRLLAPSRGVARLEGVDVRRMRSSDLARRLAILRQDNHLEARLTVRDLVGFGRFPYSRGRLTDQDHARIDEAIAFLDLQPYADRFTDQLSGGQRQRAYVAMVLAQDTDVVLLDEPLNNLDMRHQVRMMRLLRRAADDLGRTFVIVVHDLNFAAAYADRMIVLKDGVVAHAGTPAEIMRDDVLAEVFETTVRVRRVEGVLTAVYAGL